MRSVEQRYLALMLVFNETVTILDFGRLSGTMRPDRLTADHLSLFRAPKIAVSMGRK
jgi:hypothetical protein